MALLSESTKEDYGDKNLCKTAIRPVAAVLEPLERVHGGSYLDGFPIHP